LRQYTRLTHRRGCSSACIVERVQHVWRDVPIPYVCMSSSLATGMNRLASALQQRPDQARTGLRPMRALPIISHIQHLARSAPSLLRSAPTTRHPWAAHALRTFVRSAASTQGTTITTPEKSLKKAIGDAGTSDEPRTKAGVPKASPTPGVPKASPNQTWPVKASVLSRDIPMVSHLARRSTAHH
jgi:hypothetical protein